MVYLYRYEFGIKAKAFIIKAESGERIFYAECDIFVSAISEDVQGERFVLEALIVSGSKQAFDAVCGVVRRAGNYDVTYAQSGAGALSATERREFDLIVINSVSDMPCVSLAEELASVSDAGIILAESSETFEETALNLGKLGILTVPKPLNAKTLFAAVTFVNAANVRIAGIKNQNEGLKKKLDDIKIIDRAKMILMQNLGYNEQQAHRHIEKQAMELRLNRREVAMNILKTYEV